MKTLILVGSFLGFFWCLGEYPYPTICALVTFLGGIWCGEQMAIDKRLQEYRVGVVNRGPLRKAEPAFYAVQRFLENHQIGGHRDLHADVMHALRVIRAAQKFIDHRSSTVLARKAPDQWADEDIERLWEVSTRDRV